MCSMRKGELTVMCISFKIGRISVNLKAHAITYRHMH